MPKLNVNQKDHEIDVDPKTPLLWAIRDSLGLTGTKYGCGAAQCGACTVHADGVAIRSCVTPVSAVMGKRIVTIEGLPAAEAQPLRAAWTQEDVPQCGYCQSGQLMAAAVLLRERAQPSDADIDDAMSGNVCRCATYTRIRKAIHVAAELRAKAGAR
jgi:isoquinoline 1-oxidoreductase alpha subunit